MRSKLEQEAMKNNMVSKLVRAYQTKEGQAFDNMFKNKDKLKDQEKYRNNLQKKLFRGLLQA